jgi:hypothetical protein
MIKKIALASALIAATSLPALAAPMVTDATVLATTIITPTPPFGALTEAVGAQTVGTGIDFTFGNVEGIFHDGGGVYGFCGISGGGICTLVDDVDGAIVGLAKSIYAEAGHASPGTLTLSVYDSGLAFLASALNGPPLGVYGRSTFSIVRPTSDIAYFRITGGDSYGVNQIILDGVVGGAIPEPASWAMMIGGLALVGVAMRRRKVAVSFA